ncbi:vegetative cell wall protein gp1-like [Penaeus japonicus]|uniref:vegetative cell wall protein gp1-like n=1 Tax=Penaeus japonicus TaxID=27405 RepID=UPI001C70B743|nr:vegetative cell wall protein gp1-like [Penaeus japonicus]
MLDALVNDLGLGDLESDLAVLDHAAPWLEEPDASPPAKRRCLVGRRYDSATWIAPSPAEGKEAPSGKPMVLNSPAQPMYSPFRPHVSPADPDRNMHYAPCMSSPSPAQQLFPSPATTPSAQVPPFEVPVTEASDVDCDLSSLPGPLYLIPAVVSGRASLDASPTSLLVYVVSTSPAPFLGAPVPAPRRLASQASVPRSALAESPRPRDSPRAYRDYRLPEALR